MRLNLLTLVCSGVFMLHCGSVRCQITIHLDAQSGKVSYSKGDSYIQKPQVRRGETVFLEIKNYNNYLYSVDIEERNTEINLENGGNPLQGVQGFGALFQSLSVAPAAPHVPTDHYVFRREPSDKAAQEGRTVLFDEKIPTAFVANTAGQDGGSLGLAWQLKLAGWQHLKQLMELENEFEALEFSLGQFASRKTMREFSVEEVARMRMNPFLEPNAIRQHSMDLLASALNLAPDAKPSLQEVFEKNEDKKQLESLQMKHEKLRKQYAFGIQQLGQIDTELAKMAENDPGIGHFHTAVEAQTASSEEILAHQKNVTTRLDSAFSTLSAMNHRDIMQIWYEYEAARSNEFALHYQTTAQGDITILEVVFTRKNTAEGTAAPEKVRLAPIVINNFGGVKVNSSLGLNFGKYHDKQYAYYVKDGKIGAQKTDDFVPMVVSYLHFYSQGRGTVSLGGSLGLGLPIGDEFGLKSLHLFLGPSLFFGQSERFVLNIGLMGGRTPQLAKGYLPGQSFDGSTEDLPLYGRYRLGYVLGLSFNLRG